MPNELYNCSYYNGDSLIKHQDFKIDNGQISSIIDAEKVNQNKHLVVPGFIDLQIYGAGGKLFSAEPSVQSLIHIEDNLLKSGTTGFLACIATNTPEVFNHCITAAKEHRKIARNCLGLHLEGPFLNAKRRGAHVEGFIRKASLDEIKQILDFGDGVIKMMTIAPELQDDEVIQYLLDHDVVLSLGHSDATFNQATAAYNRGIQSTTHLFNAMSPLHHREPGIPTAVFNHPKAMSSIIADGHHVDFEVVRIAAKLMKERLFLITDAVTSCSTGPYQHHETEGKFVMPDGTLSGSSLTMLQAVKNCIDHCGVSISDAINMATYYPAKLINREKEIGIIALGAEANMLVLNENLGLEKVFFKGEEIKLNKASAI